MNPTHSKTKQLSNNPTLQVLVMSTISMLYCWVKFVWIRQINSPQEDQIAKGKRCYENYNEDGFLLQLHMHR